MESTASSDTPSPVRSPYHRDWMGWEKLRLQISSADESREEVGEMWELMRLLKETRMAMN